MPPKTKLEKHGTNISIHTNKTELEDDEEVISVTEPNAANNNSTIRTPAAKADWHHHSALLRRTPGAFKNNSTDSATSRHTATNGGVTPKPAPILTHLQPQPSEELHARRNNLYTPAGISLAKNQELNMPLLLSGTFSPHTVRLTEALDHLLQDDEDEKQQQEQQQQQQQDTTQEIYSTGSFSESLTGIDMITIYPEQDTENINMDEYYYDDDYTSSIGSFLQDNNHPAPAPARQHTVAAQTLYYNQNTNPPLHASSRIGTYLMISSDNIHNQNQQTIPTQSFHRHTNSNESSSFGSVTNHSFIASDSNNISQSSSLVTTGHATSTIISTITTRDENHNNTTTNTTNTMVGKTVKPTAIHGSSFQRFIRSASSSSTVGSMSESGGGGGTSIIKDTISDDISLPRSIRSSEGGAFVPTSKQTTNTMSTQNIIVPSSALTRGKPPVPDRAYPAKCHVPTPTVSNRTSHRLQGATPSNDSSNNDHQGQTTQVHRVPTVDGRRSTIHTSVPQPHQGIVPLTANHHHHHHPYSFYPQVSSVPPSEERFYYPTPMIHPLSGAQSPPLVAPFFSYNYELAQNTIGMVHPQPCYSPETVPPTIMSPLTVPPIYPMPNVAGFYHPCPSPVPFTTQPILGSQTTSAVAWPSDMNPNSLPWQPVLIRESTPSPCFPYVDYHLSTTGVVSPTPPMTVGSPFPSSWMAVDPNTMLYVPTNSYNNIYPATHLQSTHKDSNSVHKLWPDRKGLMTDGCTQSFEHYNVYRKKSDGSRNGMHYDSHYVDANNRMNGKDSTYFDKDKKSYAVESKIMENRPRDLPRHEMVSSSVQMKESYNERSMHQSQRTQISNPSRFVSETQSNSNYATKDWSLTVMELNHSRFKPSASSLCEPQELDHGDSATNRTALKNFYYTFRLKEKESLEAALLFANQSIEHKTVPETLYWRIFLELADLNKRKGNTVQARSFFKKACLSSPQSPEVWLECTKFEEERGHMSKCSQLLYEGLDACDFNEALLIRTVKFEEKISVDGGNRDLTRARALLSRLKNLSLEKSWRALLEGALLETRAGNLDTARSVFNFLVNHIPWYGPLYVEFQALERDLGRLHDALSIVERGLKENSRYGPLWFEAFKLCENLDVQEKNVNLPRTMVMINRACESISRELLWKVYLESALAQERAAAVAEQDQMNQLMAKSRKSFAKTVLTCPENMRWKVWLAAARMELSVGDLDTARRLCMMSNSVVPSKGRATVIIELARLEDYAGNLELARALLCKAREEYSSEWKVWLESVNLESRNGKRIRAVKFCIEAIRLHSGTGRLWSALSQLLQPDGERVYLSVLETAVTAVPKSGEVWCEVARMFLNPLCPTFNPSSARKYLNYGIKFTPQYGDSFLETLRLDLLEYYLEPLARHLQDELYRYLKEDGRERDENSFCLNMKNFVQSSLRSLPLFSMEQTEVDSIVLKAISSLKNIHTPTFITSDIELRCRNADPNYGLMWFYCRDSPIDSARTILNRTKRLIREEMVTFGHVYITAWLRRSAVKIVYGNKGDGDSTAYNLNEKALASSLRLAVSVEDLLQAENNTMLGAKFSITDFSTGLVQLQRLSITNRKKCLFGVDSLLAQ